MTIQTIDGFVSAGSYRWVRHTFYTDLFGLRVGFFLLSAILMVGLLWVAMSLVSTRRVGKEESILTRTFGLTYVLFMSRTGRFLPIMTGIQ